MNDENANQKLLDIIERVRVGLQMDGGDMEFVSFEDGVVSLKFKGACVGCPMSMITYKEFIEKQIKTYVSGVKEIQISE